ncbi:unnamed protein product [Lathyrus sativus]|nr:unnamed protein product [Lathyrus sativus]
MYNVLSDVILVVLKLWDIEVLSSMEDANNTFLSSKKTGAERELSRDTPLHDEVNPKAAYSLADPEEHPSLKIGMMHLLLNLKMQKQGDFMAELSELK